MQTTISPDDCTGLAVLPSVDVPQQQPYTTEAFGRQPADWMIIGLLVLITIFELWALWHHRNTISQRIQHASKRFPWLKWIAGAIGLSILGWHLFMGFPW